jgi:hypothetical protein
MTAEIINLDDYREHAMTAEIINLDDYREHAIVACVCTTCKRKLASVAPIGAPWPRECDKCQTMTVVVEPTPSAPQ